MSSPIIIICITIMPLTSEDDQERDDGLVMTKGLEGQALHSCQGVVTKSADGLCLGNEDAADVKMM